MTLIKLFFYHFLYAGISSPSSQILNETEIVEMLEDAKKCWIEAALEDGFKNPEPLSSNDFSGRFNLRIPKSLHCKQGMCQHP